MAFTILFALAGWMDRWTIYFYFLLSFANFACFAFFFLLLSAGRENSRQMAKGKGRIMDGKYFLVSGWSMALLVCLGGHKSLGFGSGIMGMA